jgi:hypothetical protein
MACIAATAGGISIAFGQTANDTNHQGCTFRRSSRHTPMIVDAAARFGCRHRFVVTDDGGLLLFVCESCGHRTDLLPVHLDTARGQVVAFPARAFSTPSPALVGARAWRSTQHRG